MVTVYNSRTVKTMSSTERDKIISCGVPIEVYEKGIIPLGPANRSALKRLAIIATLITENNLPLPPSAFIEMICDRTSGSSKQDFRQTLDGDPGEGKSYSSCYLAGRYAIEMADRFGQDPKDYFTLENAALLEDSERIMKILDEADLQQAIVIDDSGIFADARRFGSKSNINGSKVWQTCRTRRWYTQFNVPRVAHVDLRIRELVNAKSSVYKPFHAGGFNVIKVYSTKITQRGTVKREINPKYILDGKKIDFLVAYSTDLLDPYVGLIKEYDLARDAAATRLIHEIAGEEALMKNPGPSKREAKEQEMTTKYFEKVKTMLDEGISERGVIKACPGLTPTYLSKIRANGGF